MAAPGAGHCCPYCPPALPPASLASPPCGASPHRSAGTGHEGRRAGSIPTPGAGRRPRRHCWPMPTGHAALQRAQREGAEGKGISPAAAGKGDGVKGCLAPRSAGLSPAEPPACGAVPWLALLLGLLGSQNREQSPLHIHTHTDTHARTPRHTRCIQNHHVHDPCCCSRLPRAAKTPGKPPPRAREQELLALNAP